MLRVCVCDDDDDGDPLTTFFASSAAHCKSEPSQQAAGCAAAAAAAAVWPFLRSYLSSSRHEPAKNICTADDTDILKCIFGEINIFSTLIICIFEVCHTQPLVWHNAFEIYSKTSDLVGICENGTATNDQVWLSSVSP